MDLRDSQGADSTANGGRNAVDASGKLRLNINGKPLMEYIGIDRADIGKVVLGHSGWDGQENAKDER